MSRNSDEFWRTYPAKLNAYGPPRQRTENEVFDDDIHKQVATLRWQSEALSVLRGIVWWVDEHPDDERLPEPLLDRARDLVDMEGRR